MLSSLFSCTSEEIELGLQQAYRSFPSSDITVTVKKESVYYIFTDGRNFLHRVLRGDVSNSQREVSLHTQVIPLHDEDVPNADDFIAFTQSVMIPQEFPEVNSTYTFYLSKSLTLLPQGGHVEEGTLLEAIRAGVGAGLVVLLYSREQDVKWIHNLKQLQEFYQSPYCLTKGLSV